MSDTAKGAVAFDLDGTLAKQEHPFSIYSVGEPNPEIIQLALNAKAEGRTVYCFTARAASNDPGAIRAVREWLIRHGLDGVKITNQKLPSITQFYDDRAIQVTDGKVVTEKAAKPVKPDEGFAKSDHPMADFWESLGLCRSCGKGGVFTDQGFECTTCHATYPSSVGTPAKKYACPECGSKDTRVRAIHQDTDMEDVVLKCNACGKSSDVPVDGDTMDKKAKLMVRKTRLVEQHDDHCPHCDHQFREKGYPKPKREEMQNWPDCDEYCPHCGGIVDSPEMTDEQIDATTWGGEDFKQQLRDQRQRTRDRIAARNAGTSPSTTLQPQAGLPRKVPFEELMDFEGRRAMQSPSGKPAEERFSSDAEKEAGKHELSRLWLRKGQCPKCGGAPESTQPDDAGDVTCSKCHWMWELASAKEAADHCTRNTCPGCGSVSTCRCSKPITRETTEMCPYCVREAAGEHVGDLPWRKARTTKQAADYTDKVPKPLKRFAQPENWDPYDHAGDVTLLCGSNDWECASTWLWAEGDGQRVWIELKFPEGHPCFEKYTDEDEKAWKDWAAAAKKAWKDAAEASNSDGVTIDSFEAALSSKGMQQYIAASGTDKLRTKEAAAAPATTGPNAILAALQNLDIGALEKEAREHIASGKVTRRDKGVKMLNVLQGLKRNNIQPHELMIHQVPVLPAAFRPYAMMGNTYIPGAANELYGDLFKHISVHKETTDTLGPDGASMTRRNLQNAVRALYGYGDPVSPKLQQRGTHGYLHEITGDSPKFGFVNRRLVSKPIDSVGRSVITVNPELDMNQIGIPEEMAWDLFGSMVQRRLSRTGMPLAATIKHLKDRSREARQALDQELKERPVMYSRSPAWHKFNTIAGYAQIHDGNDIRISPYVTAGHNADFDGDQINVNVPIMPAAVQEAKDKLMPDKMLFSIKDPDSTMSLPKHEQILSLAAAAARPSLRSHVFPSRAAALDGIKRNVVKLEDEIEFPD